MASILMYLCFFRIGAGSTDSTAAGHYQPASYHSGLSHITFLNNSNIKVAVGVFVRGT